MRRGFSLAALALLAPLSACSAGLTLNSAASRDMTTTLAVVCPVLAAIQSSSLSLNANQSLAVRTLALACPPNPPPTSAVVAVEDVISAYLILRPLFTH